MQSPNVLLLILSLFYLFSTIQFVKSASQGDSCFDNKRELNGTCKYLSDCPNDLLIKFNRTPYPSCGYEDNKELVCCGERPCPNKKEFPNAHRKYFQQCEEYKSKIFIEPRCNLCRNHNVVGGGNAASTEFPHMALIGCPDDDGKMIWICGATLISSNYVLTAAHCLESLECDAITDVRLGELNLSSTDDESQPRDYKVEKEIFHPNYNNSMKYNDIALIKLITDVEFNQYVRPACLPYEDYSEESQLIVTGWGNTNSGGSRAEHLQKAVIDHFTEAECNKTYIKETKRLPNGVIGRLQICAGSRHSNIGTCQGDSGGPIQTKHPIYPCMYSVVGITSVGQGCGIAGIPTIYTRTFAYTDWIEEIVWG